MICMHTAPEDSAMRCTRTATLRFTRRIKMFRIISGSNIMTSYVYTCTEHEEYGPALADKWAYIWAGGEDGILLPGVEMYPVDEAKAKDAEREAAEEQRRLASFEAARA